MLKTNAKRKGRWTEIPLGARIACSRDHCCVCGIAYGKIQNEGPKLFIPIQHLDHLIPRRWLEKRGIDPHETGNILSVCGRCHGKKKACEDRLFQGDLFGFLQGLKQAGFPIHKIVTFATKMRLTEFSGWQI